MNPEASELIDQGVPFSEKSEISNRTAWICVAVLILIQYCLFRTYMLREIVWAHPGANDQASYLSDSYEILSKMLGEGFWSGLGFGLNYQSPNGVLFIVQYALAALFFGIGRLTAVVGVGDGFEEADPDRAPAVRAGAQTCDTERPSIEPAVG